MRVISLWQPYASLLIHGHKKHETRTWPCPAYLIGERIGIASTKTVKPAQRLLMQHREFRRHYDKCDLPELDELPHGFLLGTARIKYCEDIAENTCAPPAEWWFGDWTIGNFAWRMVDHDVWQTPVPVRGAQGIWEWAGEKVEIKTVGDRDGSGHQEGSASIRRDPEGEADRRDVLPSLP